MDEWRSPQEAAAAAAFTRLLLAELLDCVGCFVFILFDTTRPCLIFNFPNRRNLGEAIIKIFLNRPDGLIVRYGEILKTCINNA